MSSAAARGRGGKFSKPKRGGGKHFSRDLQPLNADGEVMGMWGEKPDKDDEDGSEEESSEEESSEDGTEKPEMTREERRAAAKARKQAAIAKQNKKIPEAGDLPTDSEEEEEDGDMPANPNHTAKARSQAAKPPKPVEEEKKPKGKQDIGQLSRREREAIQAQQAKENYEKMHAAGKTDQARADLERLALVKERREAEAARKKAETEERAEHEKAKSEQIERENKRREAALGAKRGRGGKKKA
ncbi:hypothetical protein P280DRAFT_479681 [Massarina eburnea CBS 473.64]|uniref:Casein kinase substrate phosphoprotein PP28 domain-containing protein n=1 Tax=Massarina eburnea CBS 473.64 TaxID=1395130 RepID=A0A6A6S3K4_9PLEO|nr:hypothetical protein P280DRAFT_479681 [Massarina eburnea CBS 473.64]